MIGPLRRAARAPDADLTVCRACSSDYVIPTDWAEHDGARWWIRLRCGECGEAREVVVPDAAAQRYDRELNRGMDEIATVLHRLDLERMAEAAERFASALEHDLVDADDFVR
jgi:hypothetical protein